MLDWKETEPRVWDAHIGDIRITVHYFPNAGDTWYLSTKPLIFNMKSLESTDIVEAQREAIELLLDWLHSHLAKLTPPV